MPITATQLHSAVASIETGADKGQMRSWVQLAKDLNAALALAKVEAGGTLTKEGAAAFAGTLAQESAYFRTTQEYGNSLRYDPYRGRTFVGVTWKTGYLSYGKRAHAKGWISRDDTFVKSPTLLRDYKYAWDGGNWAFLTCGGGLWSYANAGNFLAVSNGINRGDPGASGYPNGWSKRQAAYNAFLALGDDLLPSGTSTPPASKDTASSITGSPADVTRAMLALWTKWHGKMYCYAWPELRRLGRPTSEYWCVDAVRCGVLDGTGWDLADYCPTPAQSRGVMAWSKKTPGWQEVSFTQAREGDWVVYYKTNPNNAYHFGYVWHGTDVTGDPQVIHTIEGNTSTQGDFGQTPIPGSDSAGGTFAKKTRRSDYQRYYRMRFIRPPYVTADANPDPPDPPDTPVDPPDPTSPQPPDLSDTGAIPDQDPDGDVRLFNAVQALRVTKAFSKVIAESNTVYSSVDAYLGKRKVATDLPLVADDSSVRVDRTAWVRRTADLTIQPDRFSAADRKLESLLTTPGVTLRVATGVQYATGATETVPVFTGQVVQVDRDPDTRKLKLSAEDEAAAVTADAFLYPRVSNAGIDYLDQMQRLIYETDPDAFFYCTADLSETAMLDVQWDWDRQAAIEEVALCGAVEVFSSPVPHLWIIRPYATASSRPRWGFRYGETLVSVTETTNLANISNGWKVTSDRADLPAVSGVAVDDDPDSPTFWFGPFGHHHNRWNTSLLQSPQECVQAAQALVDGSPGARMSLAWQTLRNPLLEGGDPVKVYTPDETWRMVLDSFNVPLGKGGVTDCVATAKQVIPS